MARETVTEMEEVKIQRLPIAKDLTRKQYVDLRMKYTTMIADAKRKLKKAVDLYKDELSKVLSLRRKLNDAEDRLVETFDMLESPKLK